MACQPYHSYVWKTSIHLNVANSNPAHLLHATCSQQGFNIIGHRILVAANHLSSKWGASTQTAMGSESQSWVWVWLLFGGSLLSAVLQIDPLFGPSLSLQTHFASSALRAMCIQQHTTSAKLADRSRSHLWWTFSCLFRTAFSFSADNYFGKVRKFNLT